MTNPPNLREVDCCGRCEHHSISYDCEYYCDKYEKADIESFNKCDDFKREE